MDNNSERNKTYIYLVIIIVLIIAIVAVSFALFNYSRVGEVNYISTRTIFFEYVDGSELTISNQSPISEVVATTGNDHKISFSITAQNTLASGVRYNVYAVPGATVSGKTRFLDSVVKLKFVPPANGDGFVTTTNNYSTASNIQFTNGKALISSGTVSSSTTTTKTYDVYIWLDEDSMYVSSSTKRATLAEGNPSLADSTTGNTTVGRYVKNDNTLKTITVYPAVEEAQGKIIYTTNEFTNSYYSIRIDVEALDNHS